jgi:tetratricopeptide (TPR) repeat protein
MAGPSSARSDAVRLKALSLLVSADPEVEALAGKLAEDMDRRWDQGERPRADDYLSDFPELSAQPDAAIRLIYEEICLRHEGGEERCSAEILDRYPQWRTRLEVLLDCHRLLEPETAAPQFPGVGAAWKDFDLLAELGRGLQGRVFLAVEPALADRPVVLKFTPRSGGEHLALARLQHTAIVPLYTVHDDPARNLRVLCMPYFGSATLLHVFEKLAPIPVPARLGSDLLGVLELARESSLMALPPRSAPPPLWTQGSYVQAVCGIGICLAEALHYAHERGLIHLDLKPSNVLLTADSQPMLLDFHLAREPLPPGEAASGWLGGTPAYMAPEQRAALAAVRAGKPLPHAVDGRSDIYSLGRVLYEALGGPLLGEEAAPRPPLRCCGRHISVGLSDIVRKCLASDPAARYESAAMVAEDLRCHLGNRPLRGVANRSWGERWRKWRARRPHALRLAGLSGLVLAALLGLFGLLLHHLDQRRREAVNALDEGRDLNEHRAYADALRPLERGWQRAAGLPGSSVLAGQLKQEIGRAHQGLVAQSLHEVLEQVRFSYGVDGLARPTIETLAASCRHAWDEQAPILSSLQAEDGDPALTEQVRIDLLDLAVLWGDLQIRLAEAGKTEEARRNALALLDDAEARMGPSFALTYERRIMVQALGAPVPAEAEATPQTAWDHYVRGRSWLRTGSWAKAAAEFEAALELQPRDFWGNFYLGTCEFHLGRFANALRAFGVCLVLAPQSAECYNNRGRAYQALGQAAAAQRDLDRALRLNPELAAAYLNRATLAVQQKLYEQALGDLSLAHANGADPAAVHYQRARAYLAQRNRVGALASLYKALKYDAHHADARQLLQRLQGDARGAKHLAP